MPFSSQYFATSSALACAGFLASFLCTKSVAPLFVDCVGRSQIGFLAEVALSIERDDRMGMSNVWTRDETASFGVLPKTPSALDLGMKDSFYPRHHHGQWFWDSGGITQVDAVQLIRA